MAVTTVKQIAQQVGTTSATTMYSPGANIAASGLVMVISNTGAKYRLYRIFQDDNGTTYNTTTALYYDVEIPGNTTHQRFCGNMTDATGNLAIYADAASALTFTLYGTEVDSS